MENVLRSKAGARLTHVGSNPGSLDHWLFLPGGPGLGSEYFYELTRYLKVPGNLWHVDLPGDGSNRFADLQDRSTGNSELSRSNLFASWFEAISEAVSLMSNTILVGHSTGGMLALSTEDLEDKLKGLVLMNSAPDHSWRKEFVEYCLKNPIAGIDSLLRDYQRAPSDELLKRISLNSTAYSFTEEGLKKDLSWLGSLPFNSGSCNWASENFDHNYSAKWIPKTLPTLILSGEEDKILPLKVFSDRPEYRQSHIQLVSIPRAGHFPWIENLEDTCRALSGFAETLNL